jgi:osmoprotectant transport system permease protein
MTLVDKAFTYGKVGDWSWITAHISLFWSLSLTHLYIALTAVILGSVMALPLGALAVGAPKTYAAVLSVTTVLYAVPSLAVFAFLVGVTGLTDTTVILPLAVYALAIMVRSVADGLTGVSDEVRLAATAMGYRPLRRLWSIELPAAMPVIIAGLRVATVASISLVTVGSLIGIGGLGQLFVAGENSEFVTEIIAGVVIVAVLALICDGLLVVSGYLLAPWARRSS